MKKITPFILCLGLMGKVASSQNIGIGTQTPHASAQLDISSTTKGLLAPRMTTAQRNAIANPAKGLLVYDTQINSLFHYNGSAWANLSSGGGDALTLPYAASVDFNNNIFQITNAGFGSAITGITTNEYGYGVSGVANTAYGYGVYGYANGYDAVAVYGNTEFGTAVKGYSVKSLGVDARSTNYTAIRASIILGANSNPTILATHAGEGNAVDATSSTGSGVKGVSNSPLSGTAGVYGVNNNPNLGHGVYGLANASLAIGVQGTSNLGVGVFGYSSGSGVGLRGKSISGYGLQVEGNMRLSGGNTNPEPGAVLTSTDGIGNAVWKQNAVGFKAYAPHASFKGIPTADFSRKLHFGAEIHDFGSNFTPTTSANPTADMSTFQVPVTGLYHFDLGINIKLDDTFDDFEVVYAFIEVNRNGSKFMILNTTTECCNANLGYTVGLYGSTDSNLQIGDVVSVLIYQRNDDDAVGKLVGGFETYFNGHLVFAN